MLVVCGILAGLVGCPLVAQESLGLLARRIDCAALESLVVFGLIDGGIGGDTTELTALLDQGDGPACMVRLTEYGFGAVITSSMSAGTTQK